MRGKIMIGSVVAVMLATGAGAQSLDAQSIAERAAVNWAGALGRQDKCHGSSQGEEVSDLADDMAGIVHRGIWARISGAKKSYFSDIEERMMSAYHAKRFEPCSGIMRGNADHLVSLARYALDKTMTYLAE